MLVGEGREWSEGEERAWGILSSLDPKDVERRTKAAYDASSGLYVLPMFNERISVSPTDRELHGTSTAAGSLLVRLPHYCRLSILWYMIQARDTPLSGDLVNPAHRHDGLIFWSGSHALPLDRLAGRYGDDVQGFVEKALGLGGQRLDFGDASFRLYPFPRVPVVLILWRSDEEFPTRADLLLDSTCSAHLPPDILWSTAMMSILIML